MNLLCPNCQKPLTVPEQYAGQPMRCPLCNGTFTVPALPPTPTPAPTPTPTPAAAPPPPAAGAAPPPPAPDVYSVKQEGAPPTMTPGGSPQLPPAHDALLDELPPAAPPRKGPPPTPPPPYTEGAPTFPQRTTPEGYQHHYTAWLSPRVSQFVVPAAIFLVFVLTFFSWVGVYPGGVPAAWQNAWQATLGWSSIDQDMPKVFQYEDKFKDEDKDKKDEEKRIDDRPGWNVLLIFYLLLLIPTLLVTVACLVYSFIPALKVPAALHPVLPWRWGIVAAANLIVFLFLVLQLLFGFSLENRFIGAHDAELDRRYSEIEKRQDKQLSTPQQREQAMAKGLVGQQVSRTVWLDWAVFFHLVAIAGAALMFWLVRRGNRNAPRADLLW